ncbi:MAG: alpha/beta hydrolase-fold protein [Pseudobdellovibrionaceae bacterium]|jgi:polyhydroxybutyrate depolymerase|nr:alpha/beta hydrolase-fold protein [Pseudobdellovibrionaceae bacterium]
MSWIAGVNLNNFNKLTVILALVTLIGASGNAALAEDGGILKGYLKQRIVEKVLEDRNPEGGWNNTKIHIAAPGNYTFKVKYDGESREYLIHVPKSYTGLNKTPVIFAFHGGGGDMDHMAKDKFYGLITSSEKNGYIVVFPNGYSRFPSGKLATWNGGECCGTARDKNIDDVGFIRKIIGNIKTQLNVDASRIYATGMSNGGIMSYRLACEATDLFKAIAPVAGTDNMPKCNPSRPISVLHIHALNDDHVLFSGGAGENAFKDLTKVTDFTSVPDTINLWVKRNGCEGQPERVLQNDGAYCDLFSKCKAGTQVKLCVTKEGGHSWPGGTKPHGSEPPSTAINANDEIWKFFQSLE